MKKSAYLSGIIPDLGVIEFSFRANSLLITKSTVKLEI